MQIIAEIISVHTPTSPASTYTVNEHFLHPWVFELIEHVCVSHRPVDVYNIYNQVQVKMLMREDDCENVPAYEDVFRDDEDEQQEEVEEVFTLTFVRTNF